jgi:hypothetical protein
MLLASVHLFPLKDRQSRSVRSFMKLKAKMMKIAEFIVTSDHNPYAGASSMCPLQKIVGLPTLFMFLIPTPITAMSSMKQMQQRTKQQ